MIELAFKGLLCLLKYAAVNSSVFGKGLSW